MTIVDAAVDRKSRSNTSRGTATLNRRRVNELLAATILALYGVIAVGGPALHALPGFGHGSAKLASRELPAPAGADERDATAHDCPICHFHSQGQIVADPDAFPSLDVVRIRPASESPLVSPPAVNRPSIPRAPPLV